MSNKYDDFLTTLKNRIRQAQIKAVFEYQIGIQLYQRQGKAITNFEQVLPQPQSDSAQQILKSPYNNEDNNR